MRIWTRALLTAALLLALVPAGAMAAPALDGTFDAPPGAQPKQLAQGPDGNVWVILSGGGNEYAKVAPDGTITPFDAAPVTNLADVTSGPNGHVWFSYSGGILEVDPATGVGTPRPVADIDAGVRGITADADGNLWVVDGAGLVKVSPAGATLKNLPVGVSGRDITLGSDGRVWWADANGAAINATLTADPYTTQVFPVGGGPQEIAAGPAGQLAFGNPIKNPQEVSRIAVDGTVANTPDPLADPFGVAFANDGAYWFAEFGSQTIARLTTDGQLTKPFTLPANSGPRYIATGANNTLWVSAETSNKIHRITGVEPPPQPEQPTTPQPTNPEPTGGSVTLPDTAAPLLSRAKVDTKKRRLALTLDEPAALQVVIQQKVKRGKKSVWKRVRPVIKKNGTVGANNISLGKKFKKGTYRVQVTATDVLGNKTAKPKTVGFKVKK